VQDSHWHLIGNQDEIRTRYLPNTYTSYHYTGLLGGWMSEGMDVWMRRWMDGWSDGQIKSWM